MAVQFQTSPFDGDLAEMGAAGLVTEGVGQLIEGEAAVQDRVSVREAGDVERGVAGLARLPNGGLIVTPGRPMIAVSWMKQRRPVTFSRCRHGDDR
jgi:hypothetical protein